MRKKLLSLVLGVVMTAVPFTAVSAEELTDGNPVEDLTSEAGSFQKLLCRESREKLRKR